MDHFCKFSTFKPHRIGYGQNVPIRIKTFFGPTPCLVYTPSLKKIGKTVGGDSLYRKVDRRRRPKTDSSAPIWLASLLKDKLIISNQACMYFTESYITRRPHAGILRLTKCQRTKFPFIPLRTHKFGFIKSFIYFQNKYYTSNMIYMRSRGPKEYVIP